MIERGLDLSTVVSCLSLGVLLVVVVGVVFKKTSRAQHVVGSADEGAAGSLRSAVGWLGTAVCGLGVGLIVAGVMVESVRTMNGARSGLVAIDRGGWIGIARSWLADGSSDASASVETGDQETVDAQSRSTATISLTSNREPGEVTTGTFAKPEWVETPHIESGDRTLLVVSSDPRLEQEAARSEVWNLVREQVQRDFVEFDDRAQAWAIPLDALKKAQLVRQRHAERYQTDLGSVGQAEMHIMHMQIELSPRVRNDLNTVWQQELVHKRMAGMGIIAAFLTICFGSAAFGLRSNMQGTGEIKNRVKLACTGAVALAGAVAVCGLSLV